MKIIRELEVWAIITAYNKEDNESPPEAPDKFLSEFIPRVTKRAKEMLNSLDDTKGAVHWGIEEDEVPVQTLAIDPSSMLWTTMSPSWAPTMFVTGTPPSMTQREYEALVQARQDTARESIERSLFDGTPTISALREARGTTEGGDVESEETER